MQKKITINDNAYLDLYLLENPYDSPNIDQYNNLPLVLIMPGGGYAYVSKREGQAVALRANSNNMHAAVLNYTTLQEDINLTMDNLLDEVEKSLAIIAEFSKEHRIDTDKIYAMGFSAGGHLAAWSSNKFNDRIDRAILSYPAIGYSPNYFNDFTSDIDGKDISRYDEDSAKLALKRVELFSQDPIDSITEKTPPTFLWTTMDDRTIPATNAFRYANKLSESNVPIEVHVYSMGGHGLSLANASSAVFDHQVNDRVATWFDLACSWLNTY